MGKSYKFFHHDYCHYPIIIVFLVQSHALRGGLPTHIEHGVYIIFSTNIGIYIYLIRSMNTGTSIFTYFIT